MPEIEVTDGETINVTVLPDAIVNVEVLAPTVTEIVVTDTPSVEVVVLPTSAVNVVALAPEVTQVVQVQIPGPQGAPGEAAISFETVSKNISAWDSEIAYDEDENLASITYTSSDSQIVKTFNYALGLLESIVLSGDTPDGISLTKTITYQGGLMASVSYS